MFLYYDNMCVKNELISLSTADNQQNKGLLSLCNNYNLSVCKGINYF